MVGSKQQKERQMNKSIIQIAVAVTALVLTSIIGWYSVSLTHDSESIATDKQQWRLPEEPPNNMTALNSQLTKLKIWGQQGNKTETAKPVVKATKKKPKKWKFVGVSRTNGQLTALFEITGQPSLKRLHPDAMVIPDIQLLSITEAEIVISEKGKNRTIPLFQ